MSDIKAGDTLDCGHILGTFTGVTPGYGIFQDRTLCYACCAENERDSMIETGQGVLYLVPAGEGTWTLTDWPGVLRFACTARKGRAWGFSGWMTRYDVRFTGPDGRAWYGRNQGDNQIVRVRRAKA